MGFKDLKRNSANSFDKLNAELSKLSSNQERKSDDRFWSPTVDKAGNGYAVIRFLPPKDGEDVPFIRMWDHGFQGPTGKWYIENSLTSIGQDDPVGQLNSTLWNSGIESDKEIARKQKRRLHFISNIYVVSDSGNPDNNGKVFLYKYGKKIFDKLNDLMNPSFPDEKPVNPFDFWEGADFKLKIRMVEGYRNYDKSEFADRAPLLGGDDGKLEAVYEQLHSLQEFLAPSNFKSYDELKRKLDAVLNPAGGAAQRATAAEKASKAPDADLPPWGEDEADAPTFKGTFKQEDEEDNSSESSLDFFRKLASE